jgi:hypothetical protein
MVSAVICGSTASQFSIVAKYGSSFEGMRMRFLYRRFGRRCVARTSVVVAVVPSDRANANGSAGDTLSAAVARPRLPIRSPSSCCAARISASSCTGSRVP